MTLSYLVSTAGHAQRQNELWPHDVRTIVQLIEDGADEMLGEKVVGFTKQGEGGAWVCDRFSFDELLQLSAITAGALLHQGLEKDGSGRTVAMLCPTGLEFLVTWIALMRLGYGTVFVAPQCSPTAMQGLVSSSSSICLLYHPKYAELAWSTREQDASVRLMELPFLSELSAKPAPASVDFSSLPRPEPEAVSHIFHTSGTSGTPKPIPHTHLGSVGVLPRRGLPRYLSRDSHAAGANGGPAEAPPPSEPAAFTTTPLFHGGVSDLLRAWMARSVVYFYPTSDVAITADSVALAVAACQTPPPRLVSGNESEMADQKEAERAARFKVTAFLSVPYILTILAEDTGGPGMALLREMELVSTGGAPLGTEVGNKMVRAGVKLVSRLGSSECGFLMSSYRDFGAEQDWEWLRNDSPYADSLVFEPVDGHPGRCEMVVTDKWASKTKTNRPDGSFATGDLYEPHPSKPDVWRYAGRGDDVVVLSNGEKASPGPIETLLRSSPLLADALVVGSNQPHLAVLLFPLHTPPPPDLVGQLRPLLDACNRASPSFAQVSPDVCRVVADPGRAALLPKSSKGTVQRGVAYQVFAQEIEELYAAEEGGGAGVPRRNREDVELVVARLVDEARKGLRRKELGRGDDLFSAGVDSLMATRIRNGIQRSLNTGSRKLPTNVVFEQPTIERLAGYVYALQEGQDGDADVQDPHRLMWDLVEKPDSGLSIVWTRKLTLNSIQMLTGSTGSLGSFLLAELLALPPATISRVICLVRAPDGEAARRRVADALEQRELVVDWTRVEVYAAELGELRLGFSEEEYQRLLDAQPMVIHAAWPVNFAHSLPSFESSIRGTHNLLSLFAASADPSSSSFSAFYFCSSLAVLLGAPPFPTLTESPSLDPSTASPIGYSRSKWVTEQLCLRANAMPALPALQGRVRVLRVGQLCGDTKTGRWNEKEGWPLLVRTAKTTGCLPVLREKQAWLPVDVAAKAIVEIVLDPSPDPAAIYHVAQPRSTEWTTILSGLERAGLAFDRVEPADWIQNVAMTEDDPATNPSRQMLSLWEAAYGKNSDASESGEQAPEVSTERACRASRTLRGSKAVGEEDMVRTVQAWRASGFL